MGYITEKNRGASEGLRPGAPPFLSERGNHFSKLYILQTAIHRTECITDYWAKDEQGGNNNDGNQNKNQSIFDQALAVFTR